MVDYVEFHMSKGGFERLVFLFLIFILLIFAIFAYRYDSECEEVVCEEKEEEIVEISEISTYNVKITKLRFDPTSLIIKKGSTVVFSNNEESTAHKIYEIRGLFYGPRMAPTDSFNVTFNQKGKYNLVSAMSKSTKMSVEVIE
jgi:plastocyanin